MIEYLVHYKDEKGRAARFSCLATDHADAKQAAQDYLGPLAEIMLVEVAQ